MLRRVFIIILCFSFFSKEALCCKLSVSQDNLDFYEENDSSFVGPGLEVRLILSIGNLADPIILGLLSLVAVISYSQFKKFNSDISLWWNGGKKILIVTTHCDIEFRLKEWRDTGFIDPARTYIVAESFGCAETVPTAEQYCILKDMTDDSELQKCLSYMKERGPFNAVVSLDEFSVLLAARYRNWLDVPGPSLESVIKFRDKVEMKKALASSDVKFPKFYTPKEAQEALASGNLPFPLVAKPRSSASSHGVHILPNEAAFRNLMEKELTFEEKESTQEIGPAYSEFKNLYEFEEFIEGPVFHLDGAVYQNNIIFLVSSQYIRSCLDFLHGQAAGSIIVSDPQEKNEWHEFATKVNEALAFPDGVFHLEAIGKRYFLEVGARPGGWLIVPTIKDHTGIDLEKLHVTLQLGELPELDAKNPTNVRGFFSFPRPFGDKTYEVINVTLLKDLSNFKTIVGSSYIPKVGDKVSGDFSYVKTLGNFFFVGESEAEILKDMSGLHASYHVHIQPHSKSRLKNKE